MISIGSNNGPIYERLESSGWGSPRAESLNIWMVSKTGPQPTAHSLGCRFSDPSDIHTCQGFSNWGLLHEPPPASLR